MKKHHFSGIASALLMLSLVTSAVKAQTVPLFNTGVNAARAPLPGGSSDPHYIIGDNVTVLFDQNPGGYVQSPTSRWVWGNGLGLGVLSWTIQTSFTLLQADIDAGITLTGRYSTDDLGSVSLNGTPIGGQFDSSGFTTWTPFTITSGFVAGSNQLQFLVTNTGASGGLNVDELQYTVGSAAAAPEPGCLPLLALGGSLLTFVHRRKHA